ncbi:MAG: hypothetical protein LBU19_05150 [Treponema sp.]|jgi:hypothetical protein|nr:hypothetical protein [Treponema sp.]
MPNISDFIEKANSTTNAILELIKRLGRPDLQLEISDLKMALSSVKAAAADLLDENLQLKEQIRKLAEESVSFTLSARGVYVDKTGFPYCGAGCRDPLTGNRIPLKLINANWLYECPKCGTTYQLSDPPENPRKSWDPFARN